MERNDEKFILNMEISDIVFRQHRNTYLPLNIVIITIQTILIIIGLILQIIFRDMSSVIAYAQMITCLILCFIVVINNKISTKAWRRAQQDYKELLDILDPSFSSNYTINDQTEMIRRLSKYKEKQRLGGNHFAKRNDKKWKKQDIEMLKKKSIK